jgi:hypothetical protein
MKSMFMRYFLLCLSLITSVFFLSACQKESNLADTKKVASASVTQASSAASIAANIQKMPDIGHLKTVSISSEGFGPSASKAVNEAIKLALLQVNGTTLLNTGVELDFGAEISSNNQQAVLEGQAFASAVLQKSGGTIKNFKIIKIEENTTQKPKSYKASIQAEVVQFQAPESLKKLKLLVGQIHFPNKKVQIGDQSYDSEKLALELRQSLMDALNQTGRFVILDRQSNKDLDNELNLISSGQTPSAEMAKLAQAVSADLIWTAQVEQLGYIKHAQQLRVSERQLVSYSGSWSIRQKLINVATRQIYNSDTIGATFPSTAPTTLSRGVNSAQMLNSMKAVWLEQALASVIKSTFPISVVSLTGEQVILSQGGKAVKTGQKYALVFLGADIKDPQTGASLGPVKTVCCDVVIDQVMPNISYGHLENIAIDLNKINPQSLQLGSPIKSSLVVSESTKADSSKQGVEKNQNSTQQKNKSSQDFHIKPNAAQSHSNKVDEIKEDGKW